MDQALGSKYNKPAKGASRVIGITRKKAVINKWNLIRKHENANYANLLRQISRINTEHECSLHPRFSKQRTEIGC